MDLDTFPRRESGSRCVEDNAAAIAEFISRANAVSDSGWLSARATGKWSPCQEAHHLILSLRLFSAAVLGHTEMALAVSPERSRALYAAIVPKLYAGEPLPTGARSPADADPANVADAPTADRDTVLRDLAAAGAAFASALTRATAEDPHRRVQHPYFGALSLEELGIVAAAHTRHHMRSLPGVDAPAG